MYWRVVSSVSFPEASNSFATEGILISGWSMAWVSVKTKDCPQHVLRSYGSAQSLGTSHNRGRRAGQDGLTRRPGSPVDGVLEHAGYTVIIFRRCDEHRIRFANRRFKRLHRLRIPLIVNIGI